MNADVSIAEALREPEFPRVDVRLRRGHHLSVDEDRDAYLFLEQYQEVLQAFYGAYDAELYQDPDGFWMLIPRSTSPLRTRDLSRIEMVLGLALAHLRMDPAILRAEMTVSREQLFADIEALFGGEERLKVLLRGGSRGQSRVQARLREEFERNLPKLEQLGFIALHADGRIRLRPALARFCDIGRDADPTVALQRLVERCHAVVGVGAPAPASPQPTTTGPDEEEPAS